MARPIKETPVLTGSDAVKFMKAISQPKPVSTKEMERMKKNYEFLKSKERF
jgi:hypothetical protein